MLGTLGTRAHLPAYDAWNRLVAVWVDDGDGTREPASEDIATYQYDGLGRRIVRTDCTAATDVDGRRKDPLAEKQWLRDLIAGWACSWREYLGEPTDGELARELSFHESTGRPLQPV